MVRMRQVMHQIADLITTRLPVEDHHSSTNTFEHRVLIGERHCLLHNLTYGYAMCDEMDSDGLTSS